MSKLMAGLLLVFLDFNLTINNAEIGLLPDFVGYAVMLKGLAELSQESAYFQKIRPYTIGMIIYTGILYGMDLVGFSPSLGIFSYILALLSTAVSLYISYSIVMGVKDLEIRLHTPLNGEGLYSAWIFLAVMNVVVYVSLLVPFLAILCIIAALIGAVWFLIAFSRTKNLYDQQGGSRPGAET